LADIFPPLPTAFDSSGELDLGALRRNLDVWNEQPLGGYVVGGSNGEFATQTVAERVAVVEAVRKWTPSDRLLIAGSGMESTQGTGELTARMADAGADLAIIVTPSYYKANMDAQALSRHYQRVAEQTSIPILLYNVPRNTGVELLGEAVAELSADPMIVGIKESGGNLIKIARMVADCEPGFQVLSGSGGFMLAALSVGAVGVIGALANIAAAPMAEMLERFTAGDLSGARAIQQRLLAVNSAVTTRFGVAGLKAAMDLMGWYGGPVRGPLVDLGESERVELRGILRAANLIDG
jgi:4-hydroxy-2-oxoglutarate aldolase